MNALTVDSATSIRLGLFLAAFLILALAELRWPRRKLSLGRIQRWPANIGLVVCNSLVVRLLVPVAGVASALLAAQHGWGLFNLLALPWWLEILLFILVFDLTIYWQHRVFHGVPLLWRFHRIHHMDQDYDLTTGNRFHPVSIMLSALLKVGLVLVMGASATAILIAESVLNLSSMFNHSNLALPSPIEKFLRRVIVTPDMHRIHHSTDPLEHNRNFGFNFSFWDRVFRTYQHLPSQAQETMPIGLTGFTGPTTRHLTSLLIAPFSRSAGRTR